jgi:hypothetical protein
VSTKKSTAQQEMSEMLSAEAERILATKHVTRIATGGSDLRPDLKESDEQIREVMQAFEPLPEQWSSRLVGPRTTLLQQAITAAKGFDERRPPVGRERDASGRIMSFGASANFSLGGLVFKSTVTQPIDNPNAPICWWLMEMVDKVERWERKARPSDDNAWNGKVYARNVDMDGSGVTEYERALQVDQDDIALAEAEVAALEARPRPKRAADRHAWEKAIADARHALLCVRTEITRSPWRRNDLEVWEPVGRRVFANDDRVAETVASMHYEFVERCRRFEESVAESGSRVESIDADDLVDDDMF